VPAAQLIYGNVEAEDSPSGRRGYQTLYVTPGSLSASDVAELESRLFYVPKEAQPPPPKHLFTTLRSGKRAVAQIVSLPGADRFGRSGRYLAHVLIFDSQEFARLHNDPFHVFERFPFARELTSVRGL